MGKALILRKKGGGDKSRLQTVGGQEYKKVK